MNWKQLADSLERAKENVARLYYQELDPLKKQALEAVFMDLLFMSEAIETMQHLPPNPTHQGALMEMLQNVRNQLIKSGLEELLSWIKDFV